MHICIVGNARSVHIIRWVNELSKYHEITLISIKGHEDMDHNISDAVWKIVLPFSGTFAYHLNVLALRHCIDILRPDVVNVHYASGYGTLMRISGINAILSVWGSDVYEVPYRNKIWLHVVKKNLLSAGHLLSTSRCMSDQIKKICRMDVHVDVTPFGIDLDIFNPHLYTRKPSNEIVIGCIKNYKLNYGMDILVRTVCQLKEKANKEKILLNIRCELYGDGDEKDRNIIRNLIEDEGMGSVIQMNGKLPHSKVPEVLSGMDIFCCFSRHESFGVSILEAQAMEVPVVVSNTPGFKEVVRDGKTGVVVNIDDIDGISNEVYALILNDERRRDMGIKGRQMVEREYSWKRSVTCINNLYKRYC